MNLRRLTTRGIDCFRAFLEQSLAGESADVPTHLLLDVHCSEHVEPGGIWEDLEFKNRMELAHYLDRLLAPLPSAVVQMDTGMWSWLALAYFNQLCPAESDGSRKTGVVERWIPELAESRRYYRHILFGPYMLYQACRDAPDRAAGLLCDPVDVATVSYTHLTLPTIYSV